MDACYRHPGRETGVSCSNCGRPICPECMTTTPVGMRCPECSRQRTRVRTAGSLVAAPTITYALIALNVLVFAATFLSGASATGGAGLGGSLLSEGAVSRPEVAEGEVWRIVTAGFLHAGLFHLAFNMLALYILGGMLEPAIGKVRFGLIYFVSLLAGSFGALILETRGPTVGASGAIFGLMGAAFVVMRSRGMNPMESGLGVWLLLNLLITFTIPNISIGGHLGGLVGGSIAAVLLFELPRLRIPASVATGLVLVVAALAVTGSIAVSTG